TNASQLSGRDTGESGNSLGEPPIATALIVVGPAGVPISGAKLEIAPGQALPPGISAGDIVVTALDKVSGRTDSLVPAVFRDLKVVRNEAGEVISTSFDAPKGEIAVLDPDSVWIPTHPPAIPTAHITQSKASPDIDERGGGLFDYSSYYSACVSGVACRIKDPLTGEPLTRGTGPTHQNNPAPAILLAGGGYNRVGFDLAEAATVWSGADVVDLQLKTQHTSSSDLTQIVVPKGNVSFGAGSQTYTDTQLDVPVQVVLPDDPSSGMIVSGPGRARILVGVAPHTEPIEGFDGPLAG